MKVVVMEQKIIRGLSVRTTNANEMNASLAKIALLHEQFDKTVTVDYGAGYRVYGVYYNYESDASGEFSVLSGTDQMSAPSVDELELITLPAGKFMVFEASGVVPQVVIDTWQEIWTYFEKDNNKKSNDEHQRAYTTDFEHYKSQSEVDIYIAIE